MLNTLDGKKSLEAKIAAFWTMQEYGTGIPRWIYWSETVVWPDMWLRKSMAAWHIAELEDSSVEAISDLERLAGDADPRVRLAVATAVRRIASGSLTVNDAIYTEAPVGNILAALESEYLLGVAYEKSGRTLEAEKQFERYVTICGVNARHFVQFSDALNRLSRLADNN